MPYINEQDREVAAVTPRAAGELNYAITRLCWEYLADEEPTYRLINDVLGALEGAKLEFYRRVAVPYEDIKMAENGDVYL